MGIFLLTPLSFCSGVFRGFLFVYLHLHDEDELDVKSSSPMLHQFLMGCAKEKVIR